MSDSFIISSSSESSSFSFSFFLELFFAAFSLGGLTLGFFAITVGLTGGAGTTGSGTLAAGITSGGFFSVCGGVALPSSIFPIIPAADNLDSKKSTST